MMLMLASLVIVLIMIVGLAGNALTIVALLTCPRQRKNMANVFIITLSATDCLICILVLPFNALTYYYGTWKFGDNLCKMVTLTRFSVVAMSLLCITMITINRYIMVAHHNIYHRIYKPNWVAVMVAFCFVFSFGKQIPTLLGYWGRYGYNEKIMSCTIFRDENERSPKLAIMIVDFLIPCITIIICYCRIFLIIHRSECRMRKHQALNKGTLSRTGGLEIYEIIVTEKELHLTKMVLVTFISFLICYLPLIVVVTADRKAEKRALHIWATVVLFLSVSVNPFIYAAINKQYRDAYKAVLIIYRASLPITHSGDESSGRRNSSANL